MNTKGILLIVTGTVLWGTSGVISQHLFTDKMFTAEWFVTARLISSGIILLIIDALLHKGDIFSIWLTQDRWALIIFGIFGMLGVQYTYFGTIVHSNAATATILQYLMPIFIVFYLLATTHRIPRKLELFSIFLAMLGTFLLVTKGQFDTLAISPAALIWGLTSAAFSAFYTLQPRRIIKQWRSTLVIGWGMLIGGAVMCFYQPVWQFTGIFDLNSAVSFAAVIIFGTAIAFCAYLESTKYLSPTQISVFASLEPFASIILSIIFLHINFGFIELIGAFIIIAAVTILNL
ncbi:DMT family transporter [Megamonas hypermegale]|uniref:DMT family transporter n=1 Tax=Megamonas hypermegale TaxID=158847 RepID=UPI0026ECF7A5|nr:EamA family transporter [Megamonas hypermegale]